MINLKHTFLALAMSAALVSPAFAGGGGGGGGHGGHGGHGGGHWGGHGGHWGHEGHGGYWGGRSDWIGGDDDDYSECGWHRIGHHRVWVCE
jgi:hypothetical protein